MTTMMLSSDAPEHGRQHDRQRQERDDQEPLGQPEQDRRPTQPRSARTTMPDQGADHHRDRPSRRRRRTARPGRPRSAASAPSGRSRRCPAGSRRLGGASTSPGRLGHLELVGGEQQRSRQREQHEDGQDGEARPARRAPGGTTRQNRPRAARRRARRTARADIGAAVVGGHVRTRGSTAATTTSATMLATTTAEREQQEHRLQHRHVRTPDRLVGQQAEAGPGEHRLDRDRPGHHEADVEEDQRDGRQQRVGHGVPAAHQLVAQALGPRGDQVVLPGSSSSEERITREYSAR